MSYIYTSNLDPQSRYDQLEIQLDSGAAAILRMGKSYDLTANELARARQHIQLVSSGAPSDENPIGIVRMPVKGNPNHGDVPVWDSDEGVFTPQTASDVVGGVHLGAAGDVTAATQSGAVLWVVTDGAGNPTGELRVRVES